MVSLSAGQGASLKAERRAVPLTQMVGAAGREAGRAAGTEAAEAEVATVKEGVVAETERAVAAREGRTAVLLVVTGRSSRASDTA